MSNKIEPSENCTMDTDKKKEDLEGDHKTMDPTGTRKTSVLSRFLTQENFNTVGIVILLIGGLFYVTLKAVGDHSIQIHSEQRCTASVREAVRELRLNVEANFTRLNSLFLLLGKNNEDLMSNFSLLDFAKSTEDIRENLTAVFYSIEAVNSTLQDQNSATSTALVILQQQSEELSRNITRLEGAMENMDSRLRNFTRDMTTLTNSLANFSNDLGQLEMDTSRNLSLVNSSLHQGIQDLSERLTAFRAEAHSLVNRSTTEVFAHIENEIAEVRGHIGNQVSAIRARVDSGVSEVRAYIDSQVVEVREYIEAQDSGIRESITEVMSRVNSQVSAVKRNIDSQVSETREYADSQVSEVRGHVSTAVSEVRRHVDSEISGVTAYIDSQVGDVGTKIRRLNNDISRLHASGGITVQSNGPLTIITFITVALLVLYHP